jgi:hypothetical protein
MNRQQRRALAREAAKQSQDPVQQKMGEQIMMFSKLPDYCLTCEAPFDKKSKEMAMSWFVVQDKGNVRLYCPECWDKAQKLIAEFKQHLEGKTNVQEFATDDNV